MLLALFALLATEPALAADKPPKCDWKGDAVDPFTGKDGRWMNVTYFGTYSLTFRRAVDGAIPVEVKFYEAGMTNNVVDKPLMFLLADGAVVELPIKAGAAPAHAASSYGVSTVHTADGMLPLESVKKFVDVGVTRIRFPVPTKEWTREMDKGDIKGFTNLSRCLLEP
ncbi:MAG: hypothetical protein Q8P41_12910 [Pseudomonadota bacterium]|nr:hypothetical protein [Pseudomonadota bacterium]